MNFENNSQWHWWGDRLGEANCIQSLGDLATRTEAELMGVKNFGATSLSEIREKLTEYSLNLRTLD